MALSLDTMHLKDTLVLFGFKVPALTLPLLLLSHVLKLFFNNGKRPLCEKKLHVTEWPNVPLSLMHAFIQFILTHIFGLVDIYESLCILSVRNI